MGTLSSKLRSVAFNTEKTRTGVSWYCPGCKERHSVCTKSDVPGSTWYYNGNPDSPTFSPSVLVQGMQCITDELGNWTGDWVRDEQGKGIPQLCHTYITDGQIQFLPDCQHHLAGQTVPMPTMPGYTIGDELHEDEQHPSLE